VSREKQTAKDAQALIYLYIKFYKQRYRKAPTFNRYTAKWALCDVLDDLGFPESSKLMEYYVLETFGDHKIEDFYRSYDRIAAAHKVVCADRLRRARLAEATERRVKEAENKHRE
jgi:hypothetical protein